MTMNASARAIKNHKEVASVIQNPEEPSSLRIASVGIKTGRDFANLMSALMSDVISRRVTPQVCNATCNAGGKLLKIVEMTYKYGTKGDGDTAQTLLLAVSEP